MRWGRGAVCFLDSCRRPLSAGFRRWCAVAVVSLLVAMLPVVLVGHPAAAAERKTVVSLLFDDGAADQLAAANILRAHGVIGTFYIVSGAVGTPGFLTLDQLHRLAAAGDEIGAHSVSNLDLTRVPADEARRQACLSRTTLLDWGFRVSSFAYPGGAHNAGIESIVRDCGYASGRLASGIRSPVDCGDCANAEGMPPADAYAVRTPGQVTNAWTLADLQGVVTNAEDSGGGWVPLLFHHVCDLGCADDAVRPALLDQFAAWLAPRAATGTVVETVDAVAGGSTRPAVTAAAAASHGVVNGSLEREGPAALVDPESERTLDSDVPECWMVAGYGANTAAWQRVRLATGRWAERATMTAYTSGDTKLVQRFDLGTCTPTAVPGTSYELSTWYVASARVQYAVFYRDQTGKWIYWINSPDFPPASAWTVARWRTPPVPARATGLSFGLALFSVGSLTTDDYSVALAPPLPDTRRDGFAQLVGTGALAVVAAWTMRVFAHRRRIARSASAV